MVNQTTLGFENSFDELASLITQLQRVRKSTGLVVADDMILDAAIRLHITTQINKKSSKSNSLRAEPLATERQLRYLRNLGATIPDKLTKQRASEIIERIKEKEG